MRHRTLTSTGLIGLAMVATIAFAVAERIAPPKEFSSPEHEKIYQDYARTIGKVQTKYQEDSEAAAKQLDKAINQGLLELASETAPQRVRQLAVEAKNLDLKAPPKELAPVVSAHQKQLDRIENNKDADQRQALDQLIRRIDALATELEKSGEDPENNLPMAAAHRSEAEKLLLKRGGFEKHGQLEIAEFSWDFGDPAFLRARPKGIELVAPSFVTGTFAGGGEQFKVMPWGQPDETGKRQIGFVSYSMQRDVRTAAISLRHPGLNLADCKISFMDCGTLHNRKKLIHKSRGFCYLAGIGGNFSDLSRVDVAIDPEDGFYYLTCRLQARDTGGNAVIVEYPEGKTPDFEISTLEWGRGDAVLSPFAADEGICLMSGISGAMYGRGEVVFVRIGSDGRWHVGGRTGKLNTGVRAIAIRFPKAEKEAAAQ